MPASPEHRRRWTAGHAVEVALSLAALALVAEVFASFASRVEERAGVVMHDPVLALLVPRDLTWVIFAVIYAAVVASASSLARDPPALALALRAYALMVLFRLLAMSVTPLDPPAGAIPLRDPFIEQLWHGRTLTRDLFFSGHTATLCVITFTARRHRALFAAATTVVGACLLLQAVHYTIDVLAAPLFSYAAVRLARAASRPAVVLRRAPTALASRREEGRSGARRAG